MSADEKEKAVEVTIPGPGVPIPPEATTPEVGPATSFSVHTGGELRIDGIEAQDGYVRMYGIKQKSGELFDVAIDVPEAVTRYETLRSMYARSGESGTDIDEEMRSRIRKLLRMFEEAIENALIQIQRKKDATRTRIIVPNSAPVPDRSPGGLYLP